MNEKSNVNELNTLRLEAQKAVGESIVNSLIKRENYVISDFQQFLGVTSYYNQSGGNYTQSSGDYTQNGGGNYTQGPAITRNDLMSNSDLIKNIKETSIKI